MTVEDKLYCKACGTSRDVSPCKLCIVCLEDIIG